MCIGTLLNAWYGYVGGEFIVLKGIYRKTGNTQKLFRKNRKYIQFIIQY